MLDIPEKGSLLLAFSSGSDSAALLSLLPKDRSRALYINHALRSDEELEREINTAVSLCKRFSVPLKIVSLNKGEIAFIAHQEGTSIEAAARKMRYQILLNEDADYILTAHHLDDVAETFIMRVLSSSPIYSFSLIDKERGRIIRPMLSVPKRLINEYLKNENIEYSEDSTNKDFSYKRNYIRQMIIPFISDEEKSVMLTISLNIQQMKKRSRKIEYRDALFFTFSRDEYLKAPAWRREELFFCINRRLKKGLLPRNEIKRFDAAIEADVKKGKFSSYNLFMKRGTVFFYSELRSIVYPFTGESMDTKYFRLCVKEEGMKEDLVINLQDIAYPAAVRTSRVFDEIELVDGKKKIKDLEREYGIPSSFVLEDRNGIIAFFSSFLSGRDRIAKSFKAKGGKYVTITL
ncbi:MAG TPA: tRNA lysidine(34) synthetase TilS [Candidatus Ornithospirochaeta avicola]|uniref:tRNA(Ile)-lysidine synthase n=1 Tax=Candidatus Ornithospirochaeta avicola TaxID=2840896 RepID=A0A9D1PUI3_9SPIO|nr:tRNA lysidine(34) synthetase TilS [Candidatus Ornithospirochaeta avicola]